MVDLSSSSAEDACRGCEDLGRRCLSRAPGPLGTPHQTLGATDHLPSGRQPRLCALKWRWIVERTFGWLNLSRRLSKDYEVLPASSEAFIRLAMLSKFRPLYIELDIVIQNLCYSRDERPTHAWVSPYCGPRQRP